VGLSFRAIVDNVQQKFTLFNPAGIPVRATLTMSFKEYKTLEEQLKTLNLQSADHSKRRVVRQRDTLARIAYEGIWRCRTVAGYRGREPRSAQRSAAAHARDGAGDSHD